MKMSDSDQCEHLGSDGEPMMELPSFKKRVRPPVGMERRRHLLSVANAVVDKIISSCEEHEQRLLFHFIEAQFQDYRN